MAFRLLQSKSPNVTRPPACATLPGPRDPANLVIRLADSWAGASCAPCPYSPYRQNAIDQNPALSISVASRQIERGVHHNVDSVSTSKARRPPLPRHVVSGGRPGLAARRWPPAAWEACPALWGRPRFVDPQSPLRRGIKSGNYRRTASKGPSTPDGHDGDGRRRGRTGTGRPGRAAGAAGPARRERPQPANKEERIGATRSRGPWTLTNMSGGVLGVSVSKRNVVTLQGRTYEW